MGHVTTKEILTHARAGRYAVPCFLAGNMEMVVGQVNAAEACRSPVIITYNQSLSRQMPMELVVPFMVRVAERASVPVATILDHGAEEESIRKSLDLGISSVMFDGSNLPYEENIRMTKAIVAIAKPFGAAVEAELGSVGGSAVEMHAQTDIVSCHTDPEMVADFVNRTNVDQLAVSVGNAHGPYQGKPEIDFGRIRKIFDLTKVPLVLHGGSGLSGEAYRGIIQCGITKINYYSVMGNEAVASLRKLLETTGHNPGYHQIIDWGVDFFRTFADVIYHLFGSAGQSAFPAGCTQDGGSCEASHHL